MQKEMNYRGEGKLLVVILGGGGIVMWLCLVFPGVALPVFGPLVTVRGLVALAVLGAIVFVGRAVYDGQRAKTKLKKAAPKKKAESKAAAGADSNGTAGSADTFVVARKPVTAASAPAVNKH